MADTLGKPYDEMSADERAIFVTHLMYEPQRERLTPELQPLTQAEFVGECESLKKREQLIAEARSWLAEHEGEQEREAIKAEARRAAKGRINFGRIP
jgi:hypothetical protein